jgi:ribosomal protein L30/L7E
LGKIYVYILLLAVGVMAGLGIYHWSRKDHRVVIEDSSIILDQIKKVAKLVSVEGFFTEIYHYKDYYKYDIWPLRKQALVRVKAKVAVGMDLEKMRIETDESKKEIRIYSLPEPEILYLDTDLDYYDISEGVFNSFSEVDYTAMQRKAKDFILQAAKNRKLIEEAKSQQEDFKQMVTYILQVSGWTVIWEESSVPIELIN